MPDHWNEYVHNQNVARFRRMLDEATDEHTRTLLTSLLAEEAASAVAHRWPPSETNPPPPAPAE